MTFQEIRFCFAEDLVGELKDISPVKKGLVVVKAKAGNPLPEYEIEALKVSPSEYIKNLAKRERIDVAKLFSKFKD
mgnify:FL=1